MRALTVYVTRHSGLILVLVFAAFCMSLYMVKDLNVEAFPDPSPPMVQIVNVYEGKSAEEVERRITIPVEVGLAGMRGMERITSASLYGLSDIKCKFSYDIPYREARQEVINRLTDISFPDGVRPNLVPSPMGETLQYTLEGSNNLMGLRTLQDWTVSRYLRTARGVDEVPSYGGFIKAYVVRVIPQNLVKYGVTLTQVIEALSKSNTSVGGRTIEFADQYYMVRGLGLIRNLSDVEDNVVSYKNGKAILIKNLAEVSLGNVPRTGIVIHDDRDDVVMGNVILRRGEKSIPSIRALNEKIKELNERILPQGIKIIPYYERFDLIKTVIRKVIETAGSGVFLVGVALFVFLGNFRAAVITAMVIPISLALTLAVMAARGDSANLLSIGAIDFGIIADIALVLTENYIRVVRKQGPRVSGDRSLVKAASEVGPSIVLLVIIIMIAFIPIFTMKGAEKQIFSPMAETYLYALFFTLILTFTYLAASIHTIVRGKEGRDFSFTLKMSEYYARVVRYLLKRDRVVIPAAAGLILIGFVVGFHVIGTQFLPKMDEGNIYVRITFPYSIALTKTHEGAKKARDIIRTFPEIKTVTVRVGRPEDGTDATGPFNSEYYVGLKPYGEWKRGINKEQLEDEMRTKLRSFFPNTNISVSQYMQDNLEEMTSGVKGENAVKIFGDDLHELDRLARETKEKIEKVSGINDVGIYRELGQPNLLIEVKRDSAASLGLSVQDVLDMISAALGGKVVSHVIDGEKAFALQVSFPVEYRSEPQKIAGIPVVLPGGGVVPLSTVADIRYDTGASFIYRENFRRYIPIKFNVSSKNLGGTVAAAQREVSKVTLPQGYYMQWSGMFNEMKAAFARLYVSIPLSIFLIMIVLYMFYKNIRNVLLTIVAPLCAVFGGMLSLLVTGQPLSISAIVGFVSIIGISIFDTCIVIRYFIETYQETKNTQKATIMTATEKFRSILMVGLVASLGLLPAAVSQGVGCQVQKPLALVVVGGMLIGTAMILLIVPLLFRFVKIEE